MFTSIQLCRTMKDHREEETKISLDDSTNHYNKRTIIMHTDLNV